MERENEKDNYGPSELTHQMLVTSQMHRRLIEKKVGRTGVHRAGHRLLMTLACGFYQSQVELARKMEVSPATIAVSLKSLEKEGLICRETVEKDNRVNFVALTKKGERIVEESRNIFDEIDRNMYRGFSTEERKQFLNYLIRIYDNMEQEWR